MIRLERVGQDSTGADVWLWRWRHRPMYLTYEPWTPLALACFFWLALTTPASA